MNKIRIFLISFLVMLLLSETASAGGRQWFFDLIFQNKASISKNRDNIEKQTDRIDGLEQSSGSPAEEPAPKQLYANGSLVGKILNYDSSYWWEEGHILLEFDSSFDAIKIWADGKIRNDMQQQQLFFSESDCRGQAYAYGVFAYGEQSEFFKLKRPKGKIFSCHASECGSTLYYLPPNEDKYYFVSIASQYYDGGCSNYTSASEWYYYKVLPNDPAVTGIEEYPFPVPLTFDGIEELQMKLVTP